MRPRNWTASANASLTTRHGTAASSVSTRSSDWTRSPLVLSGPGHAKAHHTTNIVVSEGPGDEVRVRSKGLGLLEGGAVASVVYADELRRTDDGWRISRRVIHVK